MAVGEQTLGELLPVPGLRLATVAAGIKKPGRKDLVLLELAPGSGERIPDRDIDIFMSVVAVTAATDHNLLARRQMKLNADLKQAAFPAMTRRRVDDNPARDNMAKKLFELRHLTLNTGPNKIRWLDLLENNLQGDIHAVFIPVPRRCF